MILFIFVLVLLDRLQKKKAGVWWRIQTFPWSQAQAQGCPSRQGVWAAIRCERQERGLLELHFLSKHRPNPDWERCWRASWGQESNRNALRAWHCLRCLWRSLSPLHHTWELRKVKLHIKIHSGFKFYCFVRSCRSPNLQIYKRIPSYPVSQPVGDEGYTCGAGQPSQRQKLAGPWARLALEMGECVNYRELGYK